MTERWQFLPVEDALVETADDANGQPQPMRAFVDGVSWNTGTQLANVAKDSRTVERFRINRTDGVVEFDVPVYKLNPSENTTTAAELFLTCAFSLRDRSRRMSIRQTVQRQLKGKQYGTGALALPHDEIVQTIQFQYGADNNRTGAVTNASDVFAEAQRYLDAAEGAFETVATQTVEYAGIIPIEPDGAVQQVTWQVGALGATTTASRNTEHDRRVPRDCETRRQERVAAQFRAPVPALKGAGRRSR